MNVKQEKNNPEISTIYIDLWWSTKSDCIDGGIDKSAPRQNPVKIEIMIKKFISPSFNKNTREKNITEEVIDKNQTCFFSMYFDNQTQKGIPKKAARK